MRRINSIFGFWVAIAAVAAVAGAMVLTMTSPASGQAMPDLITTDLTVDSTSWIDGETINFTYNIENIGDAAGADSASGLYLSTNTTISTGDYLLLEDLNTGTMSVGEINPEGEPYFFVLDIDALALPEGTYYLGVYVDHTFLIVESAENNNVTPANDVIQVTVVDDLPDLITTDLTVDSTSWIDGETINFTYNIENIGVGIGADSASGLYLSTNTTINTGDYLLLEDLNTGTMSVGEINPEGEPYVFVLDIDALALPEGTYYLGVYVDHTFLIVESAENNNVTPANDVIQVTVVDDLPDLITTDLTVDSAYWIDGGAINYTYNVENVGVGVGADSASGLYLSTNTTISTSDFLLLEDLNTGTMSVGEINPEGEPYFFVLDIDTLGAGAGDYYLGVIADHTGLIAESDEENNATPNADVIAITVVDDLCNDVAVTVRVPHGESPTSGPDVILGTPGPDVIDGLGGSDTICGGDGDDTIMGSAGLDLIYGGPGADTIHGGLNADTIFGGAGNDIIFGDDANDVIYGNIDNDEIHGGAGVDRIYGHGGDDTIFGDDGDDRLYGGTGNDNIRGGLGADRLWGQGDIDTLRGENDADTIYGGVDADLIFGGGANDIIHGQGGNDTINGDGGADTIYGHTGNDTINGGTGQDTIFGHGGADTLNGNDSNDTINGGNNADTIHGNNGNDTLNGQDGNDNLFGDAGTDTCNGGAGTDTATTCETILGVP